MKIFIIYYIYDSTYYPEYIILMIVSRIAYDSILRSCEDAIIHPKDTPEPILRIEFLNISLI